MFKILHVLFFESLFYFLFLLTTCPTPLVFMFKFHEDVSFLSKHRAVRNKMSSINKSFLFLERLKHLIVKLTMLLCPLTENLNNIKSKFPSPRFLFPLAFLLTILPFFFLFRVLRQEEAAAVSFSPAVAAEVEEVPDVLFLGIGSYWGYPFLH